MNLRGTPPSSTRILDANAWRPGQDAESELIARRVRVLGPSYRLFYRQPLEIVRGHGTRLWDAEGREYLDVYNNVASVGHTHPHVVEAIARQAAVLTTHTRYLDRGIVAYAERLLALLPDPIDRAVFTCSGSEANDLAVRVARAATGQRGVIVTEEAYHGNTALVTGMSPSLGVGVGPEVVTVPAPDPMAAPHRSFAAGVRAGIERLAAQGLRPAALLLDSILSSDGVHPALDLAEAVAAVRAAGGVVIADEVQPGFGRTGSAMWGFARHDVVPEIVTLGKPMGNGMPIAAVLAQAAVLEPFSAGEPYFNTFGGTQVSIAAADAVLDVLEREGLQAHAAAVGRELRALLDELAVVHRSIADVRGDGLFIGLQLREDDGSPGTALAADVINLLRQRGVLTSVCGAHGDTLKLRPPLPFSRADAARLADELDGVLGDLEA
ncbi:aspartate aminotransferase family protein [Nocardioides fonticola]|uniref:Aspartate aminotransferase family protein n=1 Tax=Nocardioides fonticola TaxID=450363 RepID=A0ABP7XA37_9ACTN